MKPLTLSDKFCLLAQTGIPVLLKGMPGEAKTAFVNALAEATKRHLEVVLASIREASEIGGLPLDRPEGVVLNPPAWAVRLLKAAEQGGVLFLDEITTVLPSVQAALLRVVFEKVVGELKLPTNTWILAAANPPEVAANGWELTPPMANRFVHLNWAIDTDVWISGMMSGFTPPRVQVLPAAWRDGIPAARALVASFIKARPALLRQFPNNAAEQSGPWPSPRSWDMAATILAACRAMEATQKVGNNGNGHDTGDMSEEDVSFTNTLQLLECSVGTGAAKEFMDYSKALDLPDPETLLANPRDIEWPKERDDKCFAMLSSVAAAVLANNRPSRWETSWKVISSAVRAEKSDLATVVAKTLIENKPKGATNPAAEMATLVPMFKKAGIFTLN